MSNEVVVYKGRDNTVKVHLGRDVSASIFTSQIRSGTSVNTPFLADWDVSFETDGEDGKLLLEMNALTSGQITAEVGYMDLKEMVGSVALPVFEKPLEVVFRGTVTE